MGLQTTFGVIDAHAPDIALLECVPSLQQQTDDEPESDATYIIKELSTRGYWAHAAVMDARGHGSFPVSYTHLRAHETGAYL
eukprot:2337054-Pyramimonas_sp.AAC.1